MSTDILDRVRRLVALSSSNNEHEARNAAAKACALMRQHNLRVELPEPEPGPRPRVNAEDLGDYFRRPSHDRSAWDRERAAAEARARGSQHAEARRARARFRTFGAVQHLHDEDRGARCRRCGSVLEEAEWVRYVVGDSTHVVHDRCVTPDDQLEGE